MPADVILRGGTIYTQDRAHPRASRLATSGGRIVSVDGDEDSIGPGTRAIDLDGRAVVPGFVDAHVHFGGFALGRQQVDLDAAATLDEGLALLARAVGTLTDGRWLRGHGWDRNRWGRLPTAAELDSAIGDIPAVLTSHDCHGVWLSSAALRAAGINRSVADPPGGVIDRDAAGEPNGVLLENAQHLLRGRIPEPSDAERRDAIRSALRVAAAAGITGIHNLEDHRSRAAFAALEAAGDLSLRVYHGVAHNELQHARERGLRTGSGSAWLRTGPVKLFSDGALGSRTSYLLEPFEGRTDGFRGVPTLQPEELDDALRMAADAQLDIAVHAIGDAAVRSVLDAFARAHSAYTPFRDRLLRIEHAQLVHPDDVPRFVQLGVVASMQPIHAAADWRVADAHWGKRARHGYAIGTLLRSGATVAYGTDAPVERIEPLLNLYAATTRQDLRGEPAGGWYPEQRVSLEDAISAYTVGSAIAERATARRGTLVAGKDADLVVLEPDPFAHKEVDLREVRVALTMVGGRIVFEGGHAE